MTQERIDHVFKQFKVLTEQQKDAALTRGQDVVVTAGAGSGKTYTLAARFVSLLADGLPLRSLAAITFTDKAAREMRSRVRQAVGEISARLGGDAESRFWADLNAEMDAARIGTIHSLCAEILRAHPAQAVIDPKFVVLKEEEAIPLRAQTVQDTLALLVGIPEYAALFDWLGTKKLEDLLTFLLAFRLEATEVLDQEVDTAHVILKIARDLMSDPLIATPVAALKQWGKLEIYQDAGDKLGDLIMGFLREWNEAQDALASGDIPNWLVHMFNARRGIRDLNPGKRTSEVKTLVKELRSSYDKLLNPICGGSDDENGVNAETERRFIATVPLVRSAFNIILDLYSQALRLRGALDFDDLEYGAEKLLRLPEVREKWQNEISALLVDEFQDTNHRQKNIITALAGDPGKLFIVGDAKQSIYRFRRADVTVFRSVNEEISNRGGCSIDLDMTFRAHEGLLVGMEELLKEIMGTEEDPQRPYHVPYSALVAHRKDPRAGIRDPHIEFVLGSGDRMKGARPCAAKALAHRLMELKESGQIKAWDDVTLLFRSSSGYAAYENAFEEAGIPFVTFAGRGFYNRAEVRDILNILRALADPSDDLAIAGLLRSPAFGLSDAGLYQLRQQGSKPLPYWQALHADLSVLCEEDQMRADRALKILDELMRLVDRVPVVELVKKLVDRTDYRTILAMGDETRSAGRLWRNLDKLILDAQKSGKVSVRDFLDYITSMREHETREGEAPAEAVGSVRLMTIHRAKGLEFPVLVLADANRMPNFTVPAAYLFPQYGLTFKMDPEPLLFRMARMEDKRQDEAENKRLLYVALTRAEEKLLISGHLKETDKNGWVAAGWLKELTGAASLDLNKLIRENPERETLHRTSGGSTLRAWVILPDSELSPQNIVPQREIIEESLDKPIFVPLSVPTEVALTVEESADDHLFSQAGSVEDIPAGAVGSMVHKAIQNWTFPGDPALPMLLETEARKVGVVLESLRAEAIQRAIELLSRLQAHPLYQEISASKARHHELAYSRAAGERVENGYLDLLYRTDSGWQIVDFKTDRIKDPGHLEELVVEYSKQMRRYASVVKTMLGESAALKLCFLDDEGKVNIAVVQA